MKRVLLIINGPQPPFSEFVDMFKPLVEASGQFEVEVSDDSQPLDGCLRVRCSRAIHRWRGNYARS